MKRGSSAFPHRDTRAPAARPPALHRLRRAHVYFKAAIGAVHTSTRSRRIVPRRSSTPRVPSSIEPAGRRRALVASFAPPTRARPASREPSVWRRPGCSARFRAPPGEPVISSRTGHLYEVSHHQGASGASVRRSVDSRSPRPALARARDVSIRSDPSPQGSPAHPDLHLTRPTPVLPRAGDRRMPRDQDPAHPR